jgi:hypothetical protein
MSEHITIDGKACRIENDGFEPFVIMPDGCRVQVLRDLTDDEKAYAARCRGKMTKAEIMAGFARKPMVQLTDEQFEQLHTLIGDAPVLATATAEAIESYRTDLIAARTLLGDAYGFGAATVENW